MAVLLLLWQGGWSWGGTEFQFPSFLCRVKRYIIFHVHTTQPGEKESFMYITSSQKARQEIKMGVRRELCIFGCCWCCVRTWKLKMRKLFLPISFSKSFTMNNCWWCPGMARVEYYNRIGHHRILPLLIVLF